ncbi:hypothetical protein PVAP13_3KG264452 [Panicum virgatum]|uniref:Triosephosphate isomerase, cytosolic n=1 Tax=Panicum virgatum TaxID=38727 RepID=A0A8T0V0S3_PANVG|nr:hypothetical protein PVAP13_3KG264452 [Panicum virgatum]
MTARRRRPSPRLAPPHDGAAPPLRLAPPRNGAAPPLRLAPPRNGAAPPLRLRWIRRAACPPPPPLRHRRPSGSSSPPAASTSRTRSSRPRSRTPPARKEVFVSPPYMFLPVVKSQLRPEFQVAAQNCWVKKGGAFTGEVSLQWKRCPHHLD